jgi:hypothetical protein
VVALELIFEVSSLSHNVTAHHPVGTSYSAVVRRCILEVLEAAVRKSGSGMREDPMASWCYGTEIALCDTHLQVERSSMKYKYLRPYAEHKLSSCFDASRTSFQAPRLAQSSPFLETQP